MQQKGMYKVSEHVNEEGTFKIAPIFCFSIGIGPCSLFRR